MLHRNLSSTAEWVCLLIDFFSRGISSKFCLQIEHDVLLHTVGADEVLQAAGQDVGRKSRQLQADHTFQLMT